MSACVHIPAWKYKATNLPGVVVLFAIIVKLAKSTELGIIEVGVSFFATIEYDLLMTLALPVTGEETDVTTLWVV